MIRWLALAVGLCCVIFGSGMVFVCTVATNKSQMERLLNVSMAKLAKIEDESLIFIAIGLAMIVVAFVS